HAAPVVVVPAPGGHAVEVADVVNLRQCHEGVPVERQRMFDQSADFQLPLLEVDIRLLAEVEHRPVLQLVLADRELRHAVTIGDAAALGTASRELHVDGALVEPHLPLDVALAPFDEIGRLRVIGHPIILSTDARTAQATSRRWGPLPSTVLVASTTSVGMNSAGGWCSDERGRPRLDALSRYIRWSASA